jgi:AcrR family transcriptional regulator
MTTATKRLPARDRILDAASKLFYAYGIHAVGVDRLIAESGVAKATLYAHFSSKDEVVAAYLHRMDEHWQRELRSAAKAAGDDPRDQLIGVFETLEVTARTSLLGCAFLNPLAEYEMGSPVHTIAVEHKRAVRAWVRERAVDAGAEDPDVLALQLTLLIDGMLTATRIEDITAAASAATRAARGLIDAACPRPD